MTGKPVILFACVALAACANNERHRNPEVSKVGIDPQTMLEASNVQVPMPPPQAARVPYRAEAASLWERGSTGFFGDQRATQVGDILTIDIEINDEATLRNASDRSRSGGGSIGFPKFFGYGSQIDKILPGVGPDDLPSGNIVDISSVSSGAGSGQIKRNESISLKMAALVVQQLQNGNLVVVGRQEVMVNEELRELRVTGIIRPQDIQMDNTIPYDKIAEARITYGGRGGISRQQERSYGENFLDIILPY